MAKSIFAAAVAGVGNFPGGTTTRMGQGNLQNGSSETLDQLQIAYASTISSWGVNARGAFLADNNFMCRVNGSDTALAIVVTGAGWQSDEINSVALNIDDLINCKNIGTQNAFINAVKGVIYSAAGIVSIWAGCAGSTTGGGPNYIAFAGQNSSPSTEIDTSILTRVSGTCSYLQCSVFANTCTGASTINFRHNLANGNGVISIPAATTGKFIDTGNTDIIISGSRIGAMLTGGGGGLITVQNFGVNFFSALSIISDLSGAWDNATWGPAISYIPLCGSIIDRTAPENETQIQLGYPATLSKLRCYVKFNFEPGTRNLTLNINGVNGNNSIAIGAGATGQFEDALSLDIVAANDNLNYELDGGTVAGLYLNTWSILIQDDSVYALNVPGFVSPDKLTIVPVPFPWDTEVRTNTG